MEKEYINIICIFKEAIVYLQINHMKKYIFSLLVLVFVTSNLKAQENFAGSNPYAKSIFFELGGPGLASVNYDMRFNNTGKGLGFRAGVGGVAPYLTTFPLGLNYIASRDNKNFFEFGAGLTVISANADGSGLFSATFGHTTLGYRLQPKDGGFTFRASLNPVFVSEGVFPFYAGFGFGWKF